MSKINVDEILPRQSANVDFGGLDVPSHLGVPLATVDSPAFVNTPTAPTPADGDESTRLATTAFAALRAQNAITARLSSASPLMDAVAAVGSATNAAREDHVHPSDTSRATVSSLGASFFETTPGTYSNLYTVPAPGTISYLIVGGGGGGGGGGTDSSGTVGAVGNVLTGSYAVSGGEVLGAVVGSGGSGALAGVNPLAVPASSPGTLSSLVQTVVNPLVLSAAGGVGGVNLPTASVPAPYIEYIYQMADSGDFTGVRVHAGPNAAATPSSKGGDRALLGIASPVPQLSLAGNPTAINGKDAQIGGGGGGGAPSRAYVFTRDAYTDPVGGDFGDGIPTAAGGKGGDGLVYFEYTSTVGPNAVTSGALALLRRELSAQGFNISFSPL